MIDDGHAPKKAKCGPKCKAKKLWNKNLDCPYLGRGIPGWCDEFRRMSPEAQGAIAATLTAAPAGVILGLTCIGGGCEAAFAAALPRLAPYTMKIAIHGAHHAFKYGKFAHIQIVVYQAGVKGSHIIKRIPLPWR